MSDVVIHPERPTARDYPLTQKKEKTRERSARRRRARSAARPLWSWFGSIRKLFRHVPLETVAEAERRARRRLPRPVFVSLLAGTEKGLTLDKNLEGFDAVGFWPRIGVKLPMKRELATSLLGEELSMPVVIAPAGVQAVAPDGEVPVARASALVGTAIGQSNFASMPFESVVAANAKAFFQLYWIGSREQIAQRIERAERAGAKALIVTLDATPYANRDWGTPRIPERIDLAALIRFAPMGLSRPGWLLRFLLHGGLPNLRVPNLSDLREGGPPPTFVEALNDWIDTPACTWEDLQWIRASWQRPMMIKGIMTAEDARHAVEIGAEAISVSNHGGNNLDGTPSGLRVLPTIVEAVGQEIEIAYDGGVRRGGDVIKALALGARAVMIGRPWLFGLGADGERGVREVLELFRAGIDKTLVALGRASVHDVRPNDLSLPDGFRLRQAAST